MTAVANSKTKNHRLSTILFIAWQSLVGIICLGTLAGFCGHWWWICEAAGFLRPQYFVVLSASSIYFFLNRRWRLALWIALFALINLYVIMPLYRQPVHASANDTTTRLLLLNVHEPNTAYHRVEQLVQTYQPDLLLLQETNTRWLEAMTPILQQGFPYAQLSPRYAGGGIALYSKVPFEQIQVWDIVGEKRPAIIAQIQIGDQDVTIVGFHPHPPLNSNLLALRDEQFTRVAEMINKQRGATIVMGDLNIVPWSPALRKFLHQTGLRNGRSGFGIAPTWPTRWPVLWMPLDHFLSSSDVAVHNFVVGPYVGSDHFPVIIDFSVTSR